MKFFHTLVAVPLLATATLESVAQERLEELLVTAEKREKKLNEVPMAIDVIDGDQIEQQHALGLSDLEKMMPSVNFGRGGRRTRGEITVRGVGGFSRNIGSDARAVVYVDDAPLGRSSAFDANMLDIHQIEIIKGPQGTLFGANSIAGAIHITTRDPTAVTEGSAAYTVSDRGLLVLDAKGNLSIDENKALRLQLSSVNEDGFIDNLTRGTTLQGRNADNARMKYRHTLNDSLWLQFQADWLSEYVLATNGEALADGSGPFTGLSQAPRPYQVAHDTEEFEQRKLWGGAIKLHHDLASGGFLNWVSALRRSEYEELSEEDYTAAPISSSLFNEQYKQYSHEFRFASAESERGDWLIGAFYMDADIDSTRNATLLGNTVSTPGTLNSKYLALFANANLNLSSAWQLNAGLRYQEEKKTLHYRSLNPNNIANLADGQVDAQGTFNAPLPKIGLSYFFAEDSVLYASVATGAKSGGWNADFVTDLSNIFYDQESATSTELGLKTPIAHSAAYMNAAIYYTRFTDFQIFQFVTDDNGNTTTTITNAGEAISRGAELSLGVPFGAAMSGTLSYAYTDAYFERFDNGNSAGDSFAGHQLPYAPRTNVNLTFDVGFSLLNIPSQLHLSYSYSSDYYSDPSNTPAFYVDNHFIVDCSLALTLSESVEIQLWGKNITDEQTLRYRDRSFLGIQRGFYEAPRSVGMTLIAKFGDE